MEQNEIIYESPWFDRSRFMKNILFLLCFVSFYDTIFCLLIGIIIVFNYFINLRKFIFSPNHIQIKYLIHIHHTKILPYDKILKFRYLDSGGRDNPKLIIYKNNLTGLKKLYFIYKNRLVLDRDEKAINLLKFLKSINVKIQLDLFQKEDKMNKKIYNSLYGK